MPSRRKAASPSVSRFGLRLLLKLGSALFSGGLIGFLTQYLQDSTVGMLVFGLLMLAGAVFTSVGLFAEEFPS
jgi:F0F1-type ATP synthase assembly protein I